MATPCGCLDESENSGALSSVAALLQFATMCRKQGATRSGGKDLVPCALVLSLIVPTIVQQTIFADMLSQCTNAVLWLKSPQVSDPFNHKTIFREFAVISKISVLLHLGNLVLMKVTLNILVRLMLLFLM